ncbi:MAG: prepilin-type N-terminal cleavage/methylation domain-containing protein [Lachnospiraceae bacterium]|nr:prepilin-type N-terminal cleavage/methylation domain-containing protein [Lachnospiraceae bacterium]
MKKYNKGFTFYELLVVISIMSLMVGFITISLSTVYRNNINRASDNMESALKTARANAISKGTDNGWVSFYSKDNNIYALIGTELDETDADKMFDFPNQNWVKVASNVDSFGYTYSNGLGWVYIPNLSGNITTLNFQQSTGSFNGFHYYYSDHTMYSGSSPLTITIEKGGKSREITVEPFGYITAN